MSWNVFNGTLKVSFHCLWTLLFLIRSQYIYIYFLYHYSFPRDIRFSLAAFKIFLFICGFQKLNYTRSQHHFLYICPDWDLQGLAFSFESENVHIFTKFGEVLGIISLNSFFFPTLSHLLRLQLGSKS